MKPNEPTPRKRTMTAGALVFLVLACCRPPTADGAMVVERWGSAGAVQHDKAVTFEPGRQGVGLLTFDLSALPRDAKVYSAWLFLPPIRSSDPSYDLAPSGAGEPLKLVEPYFQWWDATAAVTAWAKTGTGSLAVRKGVRPDPAGVVLEIAYEGKPPSGLPKQVSGVKAAYRSGQVFITFQEADPPDDGKEQVRWTDLVGKFKGDYYGPAWEGAGKGLRYCVYRHDQPITPASIGQARLVAEVLPGSAFITRMALQADEAKKTERIVAILAGKPGEALATGPDVYLLRSAVEPGKPVPPSTGVYVDTVANAGKCYYAVLAGADGLTNAVEITQANAVGPIDVRPADPEPVMYKEMVTDVGGGVKHRQQWFSYWAVWPLAPWPARYDVVVESCPDILEAPAPLYISRGGWNAWPTPAGPRKSTGLTLSHASDQPVDMLTGLPDTHGTQKGQDLGRYAPFFPNRQDALVRWMCRQWPVDANRISAHLGDWGMQEIKRGNIYCLIRGWGQPEMTKGFQSWGRANGIWGPPRLYEGRPDEENPYAVSNVTDWVLAHPEKELPFLIMYARGGSHFTEMGWPPVPRFLWAMMKTKRAFIYAGSRNPAEEAINRGEIQVRLDLSVPALANCTLDGNPGEGELHSGENYAAVLNGWVLWDSSTITDEAETYRITLWVDRSSYYPDCLVDVTPRRCRKFKPAPGARFTWTNTIIEEPPAGADASPAGDRESGAPGAASAPATGPARVPRIVHTGTAVADKNGLVTLERIALTKGRHRIEIRPQ